MAKLSNEQSGIKLEQASVNNISSATLNANSVKHEWEFFKKTSGFVTDYLNKQINIPSTAFTPNMVLPTKAAFASILQATSVLKNVQNIITRISNINSTGTSFAAKSNSIVKQSIAKSLNGGL